LICAQSEYLTKKYGKLDHATILARLDSIARELIVGDHSETRVVANPYESFSHNFRVLHRLKVRQHPDDTPIHTFNFECSYIVGEKSINEFEKTLADLLMLEHCMDDGRGIMNIGQVIPLYLDPRFYNYPKDVQRVLGENPLQNRGYRVFTLGFVIGSSQSELPYIQRVANIIRDKK
jgi:hypothetical protein